jgi:hypothetical protein
MFVGAHTIYDVMPGNRFDFYNRIVFDAPLPHKKDFDWVKHNQMQAVAFMILLTAELTNSLRQGLQDFTCCVPQVFNKDMFVEWLSINQSNFRQIYKNDIVKASNVFDVEKPAYAMADFGHFFERFGDACVLLFKDRAVSNRISSSHLNLHPVNADIPFFVDSVFPVLANFLL